MRWPKYWSFSFNISPTIEHPGLIWLDLLAVHGTLKSLLQHHSSKASILQRSVVSDCLRPRESQHARPPCPSHLPGFTQTHVHRVRDAIQPSHPESSPFPPAPNLSQHQSLFQRVNSKYWSFSFSIIPSNEIQRLISFRMDWLYLLAVQGTLNSLLQHHSFHA